MCRNLGVLDMSYNRLEDPLIVDVLADMETLKGKMLRHHYFQVRECVTTYRLKLVLPHPRGYGDLNQINATVPLMGGGVP